MNKKELGDSLFVLPAFGLFSLLFLYPCLQMLGTSFTHWDLFSIRWAGLYNYGTVFRNPHFSSAIKNTLIFMGLTTVFKMILGLALALSLDKIRFKGLRALFFAPCMINTVATGLIFSALLHPRGTVNRVLGLVVPAEFLPNWLADPLSAIYAVSAMEVWLWAGFNMVIFLAGLQSVPEEMYEAARIDGASRFYRLRHITLPLLMPALNNALIINIAGGMKVFGIIQATTGGGPGRSTEVLGTIIYKTFAMGRLGEASAATLVQSLLIGVLVFSVYGVLRKREVEQ